MRIFIILFLTLNFITAQKVVKKSIIDSSISSYQVDTANCFNVTIETVATQKIVVEATIEGEYTDDLVLNVKEEGTSVYVSAGFQPNFKNPNDKLSAHKVVSIALKIQLPENKNVRIFGTNSNTELTGFFRNLKVTLNDGTTHLSSVEGIAEVITQSGDIIVETKSAEIVANSKYGKVDKNQIPEGNTKYLLNTVTGNIMLRRIE